uniref:Uncharacterized protein n=1 Tax=Knipowitschia caucasica TaxID=637954 RepID=A0AAV2M1P3_KNICA
MCPHMTHVSPQVTCVPTGHMCPHMTPVSPQLLLHRRPLAPEPTRILRATATDSIRLRFHGNAKASSAQYPPAQNETENQARLQFLLWPRGALCQ